MSKASANLQAVLFKEVPGGFVYRAPNPRVFGQGKHYLVTAAKRDAILAVMEGRRSPLRLGFWSGGLTLALAAIVIWLNLVLPGYQTTIWLCVTLVAVPLAVLAFHVLNRRALRRVQPIINGAPQTEQRITVADIQRAQAKQPASTTARQHAVYITAFASAASLFAAVAIVMDRKPGASLFINVPAALFLSNAVIFAISTFIALRNLRRQNHPTDSGAPGDDTASGKLPQQLFKALGLAMLAYLLIAAVIGVRAEFSDFDSGKRSVMRGDHKAAIASFSRTIAADPDNATALLARARSYIATNENVPAIADLTRVIELEPANLEPYRWRGQACRLAARHDDAIADYTHILELDPTNADASYFRGASHAALKHNDLAIADFTNAIAFKADNTYAYVSRGMSFAAKGDPDAAIADYSRALEINPKYENVYLWRANLYAAKPDKESAIADFTRYLAFKPTDVSAYSSRANAYIAKNDRESAIADFSKVIDIQPENFVATFTRGTLRESKGELEAAIADFTRAIAIQPNGAGAYSRRAGVHAKKGEGELAISDYTKAIELAPKDTGVLANRAGFYEQIGAPDKAIADYKAMLALSVTALADRQRQEQARKDIQRLMASSAASTPPPPGATPKQD